MTQEFLTEMLAWYSGEYRGAYVPGDDLEVLIPRAYDIVNNAISLSGYSADAVPSYVSEPVKNAICAETEYLYGHGGMDGLAGSESAGSMSLGSFSYSNGKGEAMTADRLSCPCWQARAFLAPTGLLRKVVSAI